jgi:voltage-gated potassium channel
MFRTDLLPSPDVAVAGADRSVGDRYLAFIDRHDIIWELGMAVLAVAFLIVGFAADDPNASPLLGTIETALTVVFVAEFSTRFAASYNRSGYLRGHWIDLVALIPVAREVRLLRLLRLLRLVRAFAGVYRALGHVGRLVNHRGLGLLITAWLGVMVVCSAGLYIAENGVNKAMTSPLDALWWGVVTLTTVGYGDITPGTGEGKLAASVLMLLGIGLFGAITATITSFLIATGKPPASDPVGQLRELAQLRDDGVLTDAEFEGAKATMLAAITGRASE